MSEHIRRTKQWLSRTENVLLKVVAGSVVVIVLLQFFYPGDTMLPFAQVEGVSVGGWKKQDAVWQLDRMSADQTIELSLGKSSDSYDSPKPADIGLTVSHEKQLAQATYPWYLRLVPTSVLWFGVVQSDRSPEYSFDTDLTKQYLTTKIGKGCVIPAKSASLTLDGDELTVVPAKAGGTCQKEEAVDILTDVSPRLDKPGAARIPVTVIAPSVGDDQAQALASRLNEQTSGGVSLKVAGKTQSIAQEEVLSWLDFKTSQQNITYEINDKKANAYLSKTAAPLVAKPAGITKVTTLDFAETSRDDGATGQTIALGATLADIARVLDNKQQEAKVAVTSLAPTVRYTRSYTKTSTGIAAQLQHYDEDNKGVFGVSFTELGGRGLSAQHNGNQQFVTASTYKLFVAFSTIKRVEAGKMKWSDANIASGRNLSTCFDDMIVKSDNACAEALIMKIGAKGLNDDIKSLGLASSGFRSDNNVTTSNDLANYLTQLETGKMPIKSENRSRLLGAMKRNVYRQGVPAGASGQVADKVGFLWGLLHDATIVYSPKGTYVLVVLTDGSSWANIAELTRKIEALR